MEKRDKLLPVSIVADRLGVCVQSIYNLIVADDISAVRIGPKAGIRIYESELQRFLKVREYETGIESEYVKEIS
jgi:excisionase family DNA binding protein